MDIPCLLDLFAMSEEVAEASPQYADACRRSDNRSRIAAGKGKGRHVPKTWTCGGCRGFVTSGNARCSCGFENAYRGNRNEGSYGIPF